MNGMITEPAIAPANFQPLIKAATNDKIVIENVQIHIGIFSPKADYMAEQSLEMIVESSVELFVSNQPISYLKIT